MCSFRITFWWCQFKCPGRLPSTFFLPNWPLAHQDYWNVLSFFKIWSMFHNLLELAKDSWEIILPSKTAFQNTFSSTLLNLICNFHLQHLTLKFASFIIPLVKYRESLNDTATISSVAYISHKKCFFIIVLPPTNLLTSQFIVRVVRAIMTKWANL